MLRRAVQSAFAGVATYLLMSRLNPEEAFLGSGLVLDPSRRRIIAADATAGKSVSGHLS
jgi:hypothetical protein